MKLVHITAIHFGTISSCLRVPPLAPLNSAIVRSLTEALDRGSSIVKWDSPFLQYFLDHLVNGLRIVWMLYNLSNSKSYSMMLMIVVWRKSEQLGWCKSLCPCISAQTQYVCIIKILLYTAFHLKHHFVDLFTNCGSFRDFLSMI